MIRDTERLRHFFCLAPVVVDFFVLTDAIFAVATGTLRSLSTRNSIPVKSNKRATKLASQAQKVHNPRARVADTQLALKNLATRFD